MAPPERLALLFMKELLKISAFLGQFTAYRAPPLKALEESIVSSLIVKFEL